MTSKLMSDISISANATFGQVRTEKKSEDSKEEFLSLMAGNVAGANFAGTNTQNPKMDVSTSMSDPKDTYTKEIDSFNSSAKLDKVEKIENTDTISKEDLDKIKEEIQGLEDKVKDVIKKEMGISDEELEDAMETLGLTFLDLSEPKNLSLLMGQLNQSEDSVNMLLDTSVKEIFTQVGEIFSDFTKETGIDTDKLSLLSEMEVLENPVEFTELMGSQVEENLPQAKGSRDEGEVIDAEPILKKTENAPVKEDVKVETNDSETEETVAAIKDVVKNAPKAENSNTQSGGNESMTQQNSAPVVGKEAENVGAAPLATNNFTETISNVDTPEVPIYSNVNTADVIEQIVSAAKVSITEQIRQIQIELNPQNLGRMLMQVSESEGQITAKFFTQNENVKTALEGAIMNLVQKLQEEGVKVDAVEVSVATHEFEQNLENEFAGQAREDLNEGSDSNQNRQSRGGINLSDPGFEGDASLTEEEQLEASIMRTYGNTLNYRA